MSFLLSHSNFVALVASMILILPNQSCGSMKQNFRMQSKFSPSSFDVKRFILSGTLSLSVICSSNPVQFTSITSTSTSTITSTSAIHLFPIQIPSLSLSLSIPVANAADKNTYQLDAEAIDLIRKARQIESDNTDLKMAQSLYEQVVVAYPDYAVGWSDLGNVLTTRGYIDQALLCYKKAISLKPPRENLSIILLNKAANEQSLGMNDEALKDLTIAEKIINEDSGGGGLNTNQKAIITNKAVVLSNKGDWQASCSLFEQVINKGEKNALPWWLRYSMALLENDRGTESLAFLQRTLNRFPDETECKAFAAALYTALGTPKEGLVYWNQIPLEERSVYTDTKKNPTGEATMFVKDKLRWGPVAVRNFETFLRNNANALTTLAK